ncbi:helix-turn-helix transcriptional regulator [Rathayibacter festucae]|uniref:helix-turn-helix transcriptional regulator n=1 Tax=Rathayibacter festucae TaxID=110937 RepID=UPI002A6B6903|nr:helix-turn-helix transcriptional regulator [Rathayibacter festucae]MDY0911578.1 helix-turn-helix transcriptional regulator [Rathayibacter festucae]
MTNEKVDWLSELEDDPGYQVEEAAADLALEVAEILGHAKDARPDIDQKRLAELLSVSEGRVSQVLRGDGNIMVATVAKYLRALGYTLELKPVPADAKAPKLVRQSRRSFAAHIYRTSFANKDAVYDNLSAVVTPLEVDAPEPLLAPERVGTYMVRKGEREFVPAERMPPRNNAPLTSIMKMAKV